MIALLLEKGILFIASFQDVDPYFRAKKFDSQHAPLCVYLRDTITEYVLPYPLLLFPSNLYKKKTFGVWT